MSNSARSQRRFPFRTPVRIQRNYRKLPPITQTIRPIEEDPIEQIPIKQIPIKQEIQPAKSSLSIGNIDIKCETPSVDVNDFWIQLRQHIAQERLERYDDHGNQQTPNKVVRIFVSSTFTDFFNEREVLIKKVFPALRDEMESAGIQIIDCDLRWGVPKDSTTEQTILTCLEELDRCFEDNGQPFFIGLISDKYGWVPKLNELPKNITERYRWIDGASITLMEFIHGAFRTHNPNAFFLIRKSENILKNLPEKYSDKFRDKDEISQTQIKKLKSQLSEIVSPEQIFSYDCFYNGLDSSTGRERVRIDGLHEFEDKAKHFLIQAIQKWYPENFVGDDVSHNEQKQMKTFLLNKTQFYVDRPTEYSCLLKYITGDHKDFTLIEGSDPAADANLQPLMSVTGRSGDGKTMLLGKFVLDIEETMKDKFFLFYYFLDGAFHANANVFMHTDLTEKLDKYLGENDLVSKVTGDKLDVKHEKFVSAAIRLISVPIVIIIDGLDQGDIHQERKYKDVFPFSHLSDLMSDHTYIIISCESDSRLQEALNYRSHFKLELKPLTIEQRSSYVETFFQRFNKTLEPEQKALLLNNKGGEHPLYLSYICENLRQFGDYSLVTKRLKTYPHTTDELLDVLLNEVYEIIDNTPLVDAFFKLLIESNIGILETDIVPMLLKYMDNKSDEKNPIVINQMTWSTLRRQMKTFLDTTWINGCQLVIFRHSSLEQKVQKRCLKENTSEKRSTNAFLADFYRKSPSIKEFCSRRVPYHYEEAGMYKELLTYLRSQESRFVTRLERQSYIHKHRCKKELPPHDSLFSQRAFACHICAMQFKLGPFTMTKSSCYVCTNMIHGGNMAETAYLRREARVCQKHGSQSYPVAMQCALCRHIRPINKGKPPAFDDPVPLNICFDCWVKGGGPVQRCAGFDTD